MACSITCHVRCARLTGVYIYHEVVAVSVNADITESEFIGHQGVARWTV